MRICPQVRSYTSAQRLWASETVCAHPIRCNIREVQRYETLNGMKISKVHHTAIICSDYRRSLRFYTEVLGLQLIAEHYRSDRDSYKADLALNGEDVIELFSVPNPPERLSRPEAAGLRHLAFAVEDIDTAVGEIAAHGIECEAIRTDGYTGCRFTFFADPDGLPIEFYETSPSSTSKE